MMYVLWLSLVQSALLPSSYAQGGASTEQESMEKTIYEYASFVNTKNWIDAANQLYITKCAADTQSLYVEFFESMYGQRLRTLLNIEKVGYLSSKKDENGLSFALVEYTFDLNTFMDPGFYTSQSMMDGYAQYLMDTYGKERVNYEPKAGTVFVDNVIRQLLLIKDPALACEGWKIVEYGVAGKKYVEEEFGISF